MKTEAADPDMIELRGAGGVALACTYGARLASWRPSGGEEVFAMALARGKWPRDAQVHGGLPVYWPWFVYDGPAGCRIHGVTGYADWRVAERTENRVVFALDDTPQTRSAWPHAFHAEMEYALEDGPRLTAAFRVVNAGAEPFSCTEGFHPYFRVGDAELCFVTGTDGCRYFWKGEAEKGDGRVWSGDFPCRFVATGKPGWVFEEKTAAGIHVHDLVDPALGRTLRLEYEGNIKFVVWNSGPDFAPYGGADDPDYGRRFVCAEGATLYRDRAYALAPGESHELRLSVMPLRGAAPSPPSAVAGRVATC